MNNVQYRKLFMSIVFILTLLAIPVAVHAGTADDMAMPLLRFKEEALRARITAVLQQMLPLEIACEADPACDSPDHIRSGDLMRMYQIYSSPLSTSTDDEDMYDADG